MWWRQAAAARPDPQGIKLGLANVVTLWLLYYATWKDALCVLLMRILIASMVTGQMVSFSYSLCGGLFCFVAMALLFRLLGKKHIPFISVIGALFHNLGQICIAMVILRSVSILVYLPMLTISGILTGAFTGLCAWFASRRLRKTRCGLSADPRLSETYMPGYPELL